MARKTYTEQERREVLADVPALGVKGAAGKHGVPPTTVQSWIDRGRGRRASEAAPTTSLGTTPAGDEATTRPGRASTTPTMSRRTASEARVGKKQARRQYTEEEKRETIADAATIVRMSTTYQLETADNGRRMLRASF